MSHSDLNRYNRTNIHRESNCVTRDIHYRISWKFQYNRNKKYNFIFHTCASQVPITVANNTARHSITGGNCKIFCVGVIMKSVWQPIFPTKFNLNTMVKIDRYPLKVLNKRTLVLYNNIVHCQHQVIFYIILCFINFSDDRKQDTPTTASHSKRKIETFKNRHLFLLI